MIQRMGVPCGTVKLHRPNREAGITHSLWIRNRTGHILPNKKCSGYRCRQFRKQERQRENETNRIKWNRYRFGFLQTVWRIGKDCQIICFPLVSWIVVIWQLFGFTTQAPRWWYSPTRTIIWRLFILHHLSHNFFPILFLRNNGYEILRFIGISRREG